MRNVQMIVQAGIERGALTDDTLALTEIYNDPTFDSMAPLMVTAFGDRPATSPIRRGADSSEHWCTAPVRV